jgi:hypothetical protein
MHFSSRNKVLKGYHSLIKPVNRILSQFVFTTNQNKEENDENPVSDGQAYYWYILWSQKSVTERAHEANDGVGDA